MKIKIQYGSNTLFPDELEKEYEAMLRNISRDKYEEDKIILHLARFKASIVNWIDDNKSLEWS
jgi:hypothetical protein